MFPEDRTQAVNDPEETKTERTWIESSSHHAEMQAEAAQRSVNGTRKEQKRRPRNKRDALSDEIGGDTIPQTAEERENARLTTEEEREKAKQKDAERHDRQTHATNPSLQFTPLP